MHSGRNTRLFQLGLHRWAVSYADGVLSVDAGVVRLDPRYDDDGRKSICGSVAAPTGGE
ncbi:hypothetical protein D3C85_1945750 [compost metagenome]